MSYAKNCERKRNKWEKMMKAKPLTICRPQNGGGKNANNYFEHKICVFVCTETICMYICSHAILMIVFYRILTKEFK